MSSSHRKSRWLRVFWLCLMCRCICSVTNLLCAQHNDKAPRHGEMRKRALAWVLPCFAFFLFFFSQTGFNYQVAFPQNFPSAIWKCTTFLKVKILKLGGIEWQKFVTKDNVTLKSSVRLSTIRKLQRWAEATLLFHRLANVAAISLLDCD